LLRNDLLVIEKHRPIEPVLFLLRKSEVLVVCKIVFLGNALDIFHGC
jgi:hypothetical protein